MAGVVVGAGAAILASGCGSEASLRGTVGGEEVSGARTAVFDTVGFELGGASFEATVLLVSDIDDACEVFEGLLDNTERECEARCGDYASLVDTYPLPGDSGYAFWMLANTSSGTLGDYSFAEPPVAAETFTGLYLDFDLSALEGTDACVAACEDGGPSSIVPSSTTAATSGTMEVTDDTSDELRGTFEVDLEEDGMVEGRFRASPCDLQGWIPFL